ncbi:MAG TPA: CaiB/BaiF CoA-transferase family protein [Burkholderiales bacterium]|jgi:crotonobetainyl-CoA:carnitine CoA-transferase CaiB-like acyl-CoA transferase|nr:CaiB/BaiF CoA-transferase family protein [Burkholderiales bacterium]
MGSDPDFGPLEGIKVLELGTLIAGPFCGKTLADFGAEVIKVEPPGDGDPLRRWRRMRNGVSLWWHVQSRNKKSITLDLRQAEGQAIARRLARDCDIVIENFRPGALEKWNLGWDALSRENPKLILVRISGYGQTGPYRERPGFAAIGEAMGGMRYITGFPDRPPVRPNLSVGDTLASLHGVIGALLALHHIKNGGQGQVIDVALYESVFNITESLLPEFDAQGVVRERSGSTLPGIAPSNLYPCRDGAYVLIAGNADALFRRLMSAIGRDDLRDDPALAKNDGRAAQMARIDNAIAAWTSKFTQEEVLERMEKAEVPAGRIYTAADIAADPHYAARGMIQEVLAGDGEPLKVPGVIPKLSATPGAIRTPAPKLGEHTEQVLLSIGFGREEISRLRKRKVI